ncbi:nucleoside hydrolase [Amedibacillus dolichus]|nr:nucleoside hydrolase [Amedibacillus dolichus]
MNNTTKRKVIIDCDPGIDDSLAIMLALSCEEIEVVGITIVCGNAPVEMGFENAKKVLKHMNRLDIPIYIGADKPLSKTYINALDTHGADGLGESFLDNVEGYRQDDDAITFLSKTLQKDICSVIAIGPLTNLALLIKTNEEAFNHIDQLVSMGGNYRSHGNCSPVAEYNYWEDPDAAAIVYEQMRKIHKQIHMVGLDVTRKIVLTPNLLAYLERLDSVHGSFIRKITDFYFTFHWEWEHIIGCVINDPLAVAYFLKPELCSGITASLEIATDGIARGQSIVDAYDFYKKEANAVVLNQVDVEGFFTLFYSKLLNKAPQELDLLKHLISEETV